VTMAIQNKLLIGTAALCGVLVGPITTAEATPVVPHAASPAGVSINPAQLQAYLKQACGLWIAYPFARLLIAQFIPGSDSVTGFFTQICTAFSTSARMRGVTRGGTVVTKFRGVTVRAQRVR
jgi:hypothetical protein